MTDSSSPVPFSAPGSSTSWSVAALLLAVGDALAARFAAVSVRGDLSGFTRAASGHCYFTLKDSSGAAAGIRCAMFRRAALAVEFPPRDGQQVELRGRLAVYEARGELQMVVEAMLRVGVGSLYEEFLRMRARLDALGLFDPSRKRALPSYPATIGVVTSLQAAALHDVLTALQRRAPQIRVIVYPCLVQGAEAPPTIVDALARAAQRTEVDLLVLCRGGGSLEDLWAFNDERVVRAVAASPLPIVCGVGHETDVTLADLAADLRAATPTAAAELAAPSLDELRRALLNRQNLLLARLQQRLDSAWQRLDRLSLQLQRPSQWVLSHARQLASLANRREAALGHALRGEQWHTQRAGEALVRALRAALISERTRLAAGSLRLASMDPKQVLARGYAWIETEDGGPVVRAAQLKPQDALRATWADGEVHAVVTAMHLLPP